MGTPEKRMLIDICVPTSRVITERKPDLVVRLKKERKIIIFEVGTGR